MFADEARHRLVLLAGEALEAAVRDHSRPRPTPPSVIKVAELAPAIANRQPVPADGAQQHGLPLAPGHGRVGIQRARLQQVLAHVQQLLRARTVAHKPDGTKRMAAVG